MLSAASVRSFWYIFIASCVLILGLFVFQTIIQAEENYTYDSTPPLTSMRADCSNPIYSSTSCNAESASVQVNCIESGTGGSGCENTIYTVRKTDNAGNVIEEREYCIGNSLHERCNDFSGSITFTSANWPYTFFISRNTYNNIVNAKSFDKAGNISTNVTLTVQFANAAPTVTPTPTGGPSATPTNTPPPGATATPTPTPLPDRTICGNYCINYSGITSCPSGQYMVVTYPSSGRCSVTCQSCPQGQVSRADMCGCQNEPPQQPTAPPIAGGPLNFTGKTLWGKIYGDADRNKQFGSGDIPLSATQLGTATNAVTLQGSSALGTITSSVPNLLRGPMIYSFAYIRDWSQQGGGGNYVEKADYETFDFTKNTAIAKGIATTAQPITTTTSYNGGISVETTYSPTSELGVIRVVTQTRNNGQFGSTSTRYQTTDTAPITGTCGDSCTLQARPKFSTMLFQAPNQQCTCQSMTCDEGSGGCTCWEYGMCRGAAAFDDNGNAIGTNDYYCTDTFQDNRCTNRGWKFYLQTGQNGTTPQPATVNAFKALGGTPTEGKATYKNFEIKGLPLGSMRSNFDLTKFYDVCSGCNRYCDCYSDDGPGNGYSCEFPLGDFQSHDFGRYNPNANYSQQFYNSICPSPKKDGLRLPPGEYIIRMAVSGGTVSVVPRFMERVIVPSSCGETDCNSTQDNVRATLAVTNRGIDAQGKQNFSFIVPETTAYPPTPGLHLGYFFEYDVTTLDLTNITYSGLEINPINMYEASLTMNTTFSDTMTAQVNYCVSPFQATNPPATYPQQVANSTTNYAACGASAAGNGTYVTPETMKTAIARGNIFGGSENPGTITRNDILLSPPYYKITGNVFIDFNHNVAKDGVDIDYSGITLTLSGTSTGTTTTDGNGNYTFTNLPPGNYTVTMTLPSGFTTTYPSAPTNPRSVSLSADAVANFSMTPLYQIGGNVFLDINKNEIKDSGETNYTGSITITSGGNGTITYSAGAYTITGLLSGTYTISYTSLPADYKMTYPKNIGTPTYTITVGKNPACSTDTSHGSTCYIIGTNDGNIQNLNFGITNSYSWIQGKGGDMRIDDAFTLATDNYRGFIDPVPSAQLALLVGTGTTPGIIYSGNSTPNFCNGSTTGSCFERSSATRWLVYPDSFNTAALTALRTSYESIRQRALAGGIKIFGIPLECDVNNCTLPNNTTDLPKGVYLSPSSLYLNAFTVSANTHYVILVEGNLYLRGAVKVPAGSTLTFSVTGNIIVDKTLGEAATTTACDTVTAGHPGCTVEGFYSADGSFVVETATTTGNLCNANGTPLDKRLNIAGAVVVNAKRTGGTFQNKRDLCNSNATSPSMSFTERPDMILLAPEVLKKQNFVTKEIAP